MKPGRNRVPAIVLLGLLSILPSANCGFERGWTYKYVPTGEHSGWRTGVTTAALDAEENILLGAALLSPSNTTASLLIKLDRDGHGLGATMLGELGTPSPSRIAIDDAGNAFLIAAYGAFETGFDYWTAKVSREGQLLWSSRYGSADGFTGNLPNDLAVDGSGGVYVTGNSVADIATIRYDAQGVRQWVRRYDSGIYPSTDKGYRVLKGPDDNLTVVGVASAGVNRDEVVAVTYSPQGVQLRLTRYALGAGDLAGLVLAELDHSGNLIVAVNAIADLLLKYDPLGNLLWARSPEMGDITSVEINQSGQILLSGYIYRSSEIGYDAVCSVFDPAGNEVWQTQFDGGAGLDDRATASWWQDDGSVLAIGTGYTNGSAFGAIALGFDSNGNLTDYAWKGGGHPLGVANKHGRLYLRDESSEVTELVRFTTPGQPGIIQPPAAVTVIESNSATFSVTAEGQAPLNYRWRRNGIVIQGATNSTLVLSNLGRSSSGQRISVEVWNGAGRTLSPGARLTVLVPPRLGNAASILATVGETVTLSANGGGTPPITNQWFFEGELQAIQTNLLVIPKIGIDQAGRYRAEVRNIAGAATQEWQVTVANPMPIVWTNSLFGPAESADVTLDLNGNVFVTYSRANRNAFTAKYDPNGTPIWLQTGGGDTVRLDGGNHLYVAGRSAASAGVYVAKYSIDGVPAWTDYPSIAVTNARLARLTLARDGGCFVGTTGRTSTNGNDSIVISRIGPGGSKLWQTEFTTNGIIGSLLSGMVTLPDGSLATVGRLGTNGWVAVLNENGTLAWQAFVDTDDTDSIYGGNPVSHVACAEEGNFVIAATTITASTTSNRVVLGKYSGTGERLWLQRFPAVDHHWKTVAGLAVDNDQNIVLGLTFGEDVVLKFTKDGVPVWTNRYFGFNFHGAIRLDAVGNIWDVGNGFDLGFYFDFAAVKIDLAGRRLGLSRYRGTPWDAFIPLSFAPHLDGSIYVVGNLGGQSHLIKLGLRALPTMLSLTPTQQPAEVMLELTGEAGFSYTIQSSESLHDWRDWTNSPNVSGTLRFKESSENPARLFRALRNP